MMAPQNKILLLTNSEYGQANVILALAHELAIRGGFDIHVASFPVLGPRLTLLRDKASKSSGEVSTITFHPLAGLSMQEAFTRYRSEGELPHPPGIKGAIVSYYKVPDFVANWSGPEYLHIHESCLQVLKSVDPSVVVVDVLFSQAIDACKALSRKYIVASPNSLKEAVISMQPNLAAFWKYPAVSSGFPFPLPWYLIPFNIYLNIRVILAMMSSPRLRMLAKYRKDHGITDVLPLFVPYSKDVQLICPGLPEIDFPFVIPSNVTPCGPILLLGPPVSESDPGLAAWLRRAPTILVNFGTHAQADASFALELARGLRVVLGHRPDLQVLWKLKSEESLYDDVSPVLGKEMASGRVRIEKWLVAEPLSILQSGQVVCSVHHGGANSYYEATSAGVPQVIVAMWYDLYDFAARVEYLGIGVYGNRNVAPNVDAAEFSRGLTTVVGGGNGDEMSKRMRQRAENLGEICRKAGGKELACDKIIEFMHSK